MGGVFLVRCIACLCLDFRWLLCEVFGRHRFLFEFGLFWFVLSFLENAMSVCVRVCVFSGCCSVAGVEGVGGRSSLVQHLV